MASPASGASRFIIFFQGRSGSTYLVEALDSHPRISCEVERLVGLRKHGPQAQLDWVHELFHEANQRQVDAIGFKTKLDDILKKESLAELLRQMDVKVILLSRLNVMKMVISWFNSERLYAITGDWNIYPPASRLGPFEINLDEFDRRLGLVLHGKSRLDVFVRALKLPMLHIYYEDLLVNQRRVFEQVCGFLRVPSLPLRGRCRKVTDDDLRKVVTNFDDLFARYRGSHYQQMLEEVLRPLNGADSGN